MGTLQMLWINILMDTFAALALATEPPSLALLEQKPYSRADSIVTPVMWRNILGQVVYQLIIFFLFLFLIPASIIPYSFFHAAEDGYVTPVYWVSEAENKEVYNANYYGKCMINGQLPTVGTPWTACGNNGYMVDVRPDFTNNPIKARHYAFLFNTYVMLQIFNEINARKLLPNEINPFAGFFNNKFFLLILVISIVVQIALVDIDFLAAVLKIRPLNLYENLVSIGIGASCIIWGFVIRILPLSWFGTIHIDENPLSDEEEAKSLVSTLRKSHRQSVRKSVRQTHDYNQRESMRQLSIRKSRAVSGVLRPSRTGDRAQGAHASINI